MTTLLQRARATAAGTPTDRLRSVDMVRAGSMLVVVFGHWLMALVWIAGGSPHFGHILAEAEWTHYLTWALQVMPLFFIAGGFSNGRSLAAAARRGEHWTQWLASRVRRLMVPVVPVVIVWSVIVAVAGTIDPSLTRVASGAALVPLWFLAVYLLAVVTAPLTHRLHQAFGGRVVLVGAIAAVAVDLLRFGAGWEWIGWANYIFVWLTIHQVGYLWDRRPAPRVGLALAPIGLAAMVALTVWGPYPNSMVGVPGEAISNTTPPTIVIGALALLQAGLWMATTPALERWLRRERPWTAVVLLNGVIMSLYVWHMTALVIGSLVLTGLGTGLIAVTPLSGAWWMRRPEWMAILAALTAILIGVFHRFERRSGRPVERAKSHLIAGVGLLSATLATMLVVGIGNDAGHLRLWLPAAFLGGAFLTGAIGPRTR